MVNYAEAVKKPFTDWVKLLIGVIISIIPIVSWIAKGFAIECSGVGRNNPSPKMPQWKYWGDLFVKGLLADIIGLIYAVPALIIFLSVIGVFIDQLPMFDYSTGEGFSKDIIQSLVPEIITAAPLVLVGLALLLLAAYVSPMAILNYVKYKRFGKAFAFNEIFKKTIATRYLSAWLVVVILAVAISIILSIIPILGPAAASFIASVIGYSLFGQVYRKK